MTKMKPKMVPYGRKQQEVRLVPGIYYWNVNNKQNRLVLVQRKGENTFAYDSFGKEYRVAGYFSEDSINHHDLRGPLNDKERKRILSHTLNELLMLNERIPQQIPEEKKVDWKKVRLV